MNNRDKNLALWELAVHYESQRGNIAHEEVIERMGTIVDIMDASIHSGFVIGSKLRKLR